MSKTDRKDDLIKELLTRITELTKLLLKMKHGNSMCWCDVALGNPMLGGKHTDLCQEIRNTLIPNNMWKDI